MKWVNQIILFIILFISIISQAQIKSEYNQYRIFYQTPLINQWGFVGDTEIIKFDMTERGYQNSYEEILKIIKSYNIEFKNTKVNETLFDRKSYTDYDLINIGIHNGTITIQKIWTNGIVSVAWVCNPNVYFICLQEKQFKRI